MPVLKEGCAVVDVKPGMSRRLLYGKDLMMVVIEFTNGPWANPETPHHHIHEQTTYVAEGDIIFFCEDEPEQRLGPGDMFYVPSGKKHNIRLLSKTAKLIDCFNPLRTDILTQDLPHMNSGFSTRHQ